MAKDKPKKPKQVQQGVSHEHGAPSKKPKKNPSKGTSTGGAFIVAAVAVAAGAGAVLWQRTATAAAVPPIAPAYVERDQEGPIEVYDYEMYFVVQLYKAVSQHSSINSKYCN